MANPYDLINIVVHHVDGSTIAQMRPFEFDSEFSADGINNHFGIPVKPSKCALTCPGCGAYIEIDMATMCDGEYEKKCNECYVPPKIPSNLMPFKNPSETILDIVYVPVIDGDINNEDDDLSDLLEALDNG